MPVVAVFPSNAGQVRPDTPRPEGVGQIEGILSDLRNRAPSFFLSGRGPYIMGVTVPAAFAEIDSLSPFEQLAIGRALGLYLFQLSRGVRTVLVTSFTLDSFMTAGIAFLKTSR